jgi:FixJ family two-component response regulator
LPYDADRRPKDQPVKKMQLISIVDDDAVVREATADLVNALGYAASTFASAEQFLISGKIDETDCLITDLQMPGMDGLGLQSRLLEDGRRTPVIFITAFPKASSRHRALAAGAIAFLTKPFKEKSLLRSLEIALKKGGQSDDGTTH